MNTVGNLSLTLPAPLASLNLTGTTGSAAPSSFGEFIKGAVDSLEKTHKNAEQEIAKAVTGESQDLHRTIAALQTADLGLQLALQVRNKFVNAFEEIMRMQV